MRRGVDQHTSEEWKKDCCEWDERKEKGWHACSDDTQRDLEKEPNQPFDSWPDCTACTEEETACRHGKGFQQ